MSGSDRWASVYAWVPGEDVIDVVAGNLPPSDALRYAESFHAVARRARSRRVRSQSGSPLYDPRPLVVWAELPHASKRRIGG